MASAVRETHRRNGHPVDGTLARELELQEQELRHAGELPRNREAAREAERAERRARSRSKVQLCQPQRVSVLSVMGIALTVVLAVLVLMSYIQLMTLSSETVELQSQMAELTEEHVKLKAQYEQMFDLSSVKAAAEAAGMSKPSSSQICYLDDSDGDSAVIYQQERPSFFSRILDSLHHCFYAVVEYLE